MGEVVPLRRPGTPDPLDDDGRLDRIRNVCALGGVPQLSLFLFEMGAAPDDVARAIAQALGVTRKPAPFPDLIADPFPRDDD